MAPSRRSAAHENGAASLRCRPGVLLSFYSGRLRLPDVRGLEPLGPLHDVELQALALGQRLEAFARDRRIMNENVFSAFLLDETETLCFVEPLHIPNRHSDSPYLRGHLPQRTALPDG